MIDRRLFLQGFSATAIAASLSSETSAAAPVDPQAARQVERQIAPSTDISPLRIGIIGPGSRGRELVHHLLRIPGVRIVAAADPHSPRFAQLNQVCGYRVHAYTDYRALLDRNDLDAIVVATPLGLHASHIVPALESGHHVYGEKTMAFTVDEAQQIAAAARSTDRIYQVGYQYRYHPGLRAAIARVRSGEIGSVTHIHGFWNGFDDWRRPVPTPDPDGRFEHLINWRLYHQWSLGLIAELGSHHIDIANWVFGATPTAALASGSICFHHDGRETDDIVQVVLSYPAGRRFVFTSMTDTTRRHDELCLYGTRGSLSVSLQDATFSFEPREIANAPTTANPEDATAIAIRAFAHCVRTNTQPVADSHVGLASALGVIQANQALRDKKEVAVPALTMEAGIHNV